MVELARRAVLAAVVLFSVCVLGAMMYSTRHHQHSPSARPSPQPLTEQQAAALESERRDAYFQRRWLEWSPTTPAPEPDVCYTQYPLSLIDPVAHAELHLLHVFRDIALITHPAPNATKETRARYTHFKPSNGPLPLDARMSWFLNEKFLDPQLKQLQTEGRFSELPERFLPEAQCTRTIDLALVHQREPTSDGKHFGHAFQLGILPMWMARMLLEQPSIAERLRTQGILRGDETPASFLAKMRLSMFITNGDFDLGYLFPVYKALGLDFELREGSLPAGVSSSASPGTSAEHAVFWATVPLAPAAETLCIRRAVLLQDAPMTYERQFSQQRYSTTLPSFVTAVRRSLGLQPADITSRYMRSIAGLTPQQEAVMRPAVRLERLRFSAAAHASSSHASAAAAKRTHPTWNIVLASRLPKANMSLEDFENKRRLLNENQLVARLRQALTAACVPYSLRQVDLGKLPMAEQIRLMGETDLMLGLHGSQLHNQIWMPAGATLLEIMPMGWMNRIFRNLARLTGKRYIMYRPYEEDQQVAFQNNQIAGTHHSHLIVDLDDLSDLVTGLAPSPPSGDCTVDDSAAPVRRL